MYCAIVFVFSFRLARKAELARQSRRRKKAYVSNLERKIEELTEKVIQLQKTKETSSQSVAMALCAMAELQQMGGRAESEESDKTQDTNRE